MLVVISSVRQNVELLESLCTTLLNSHRWLQSDCKKAIVARETPGKTKDIAIAIAGLASQKAQYFLVLKTDKTVKL